MGESEYDLVMPFVLVESEGGPYDDAAFVAGATCGALMEELRVCQTLAATPKERYVDEALLPQVDLIAMRYGFSLEQGELDEASGWQLVSFTVADSEEG
ncbi:hypothetical protein AB0M61_01600 [Streptomyces sp. NPDC051642]|uniref:hypothetical protein n=1 Tax=Streptomyces sp. NPDC051642 TaxID=3154646 RepID=UPI0034478D73